jgi:hypothetical protein
MERRHDEGGEADEGAQPALQRVGCAFLFLDEVFRPSQRLFADARGGGPDDRAGLGFDDGDLSPRPS